MTAADGADRAIGADGVDRGDGDCDGDGDETLGALSDRLDAERLVGRDDERRRCWRSTCGPHLAENAAYRTYVGSP